MWEASPDADISRSGDLSHKRRIRSKVEKIGDIIGRVVPSMKNRPSRATSGKAVKPRDNTRIGGDIESLWCRVVDENMRAHSYVEFLRNGTLFVKVDSSCFLSALAMQRSAILARLREAGGGVQDIRFRM